VSYALNHLLASDAWAGSFAETSAVALGDYELVILATRAQRVVGFVEVDAYVAADRSFVVDAPGATCE
jgi:hypothetical protein